MLDDKEIKNLSVWIMDIMSTWFIRVCLVCVFVGFGTVGMGLIVFVFLLAVKALSLLPWP